LSRPAIYAANNKKAVITSGRRIPVPTSSVSDLSNSNSVRTNIDFQDVVTEAVTVAGRELTRVSDGAYDPGGIYEILVPSGDTVWAVSATDPVLPEIVQAFPG